LSTLKIQRSTFNGTLSAPPSKSFSHRAIICGALSGSKCNISPMLFSEDIFATTYAMREIGANINICENMLEIESFKPNNNTTIIDCRDSGSTLRFLIPIVAALGLNAVFKRSLSLAKRPIITFLEILSKAGIKFEMCSDLSLKISGSLRPGKFFVPGNITSQFISGLLLALPLLQGDSEIELTSNLESRSYVNITIEVMKSFGVYAEKRANGFFIKGGQKYKPRNYTIEGDWSQAAFFIAAGAIKGCVKIENLNRNSSQGDREILEILSSFGAKISWKNSTLTAESSHLKGVNIDASEIPDLVPILAVVGANAEGTTNITGVKRLKFKECNRLKAIYNQLLALGVDIKIYKDALKIRGNGKYKGGSAWSHKDHRIAMALSIMAINLPEYLEITDAQSVNKSYPHFFKDYNLLGGKASVVNLGK